MALKIEGQTIEIPPNMSGLFHQYHDRLLANGDLKDPDVLLLSVFIVEKNNGTTGASKEKLKLLFSAFGRQPDNIRKVLYSDRKSKKKFFEESKGNLTLSVYGLERIEEILHQVEKSPVLIISSGKSFTALARFHEFLDKYVGGHNVLLCDSYISHITLFPFGDIRKGIKSLKIITSQAQDVTKLKEYVKKLKKENGIYVDIRTNKKIHDRYLIAGDTCWFIGTSIKDLGNKDTIVREISDVKKVLKDQFQMRWAEGTTL